MIGPGQWIVAGAIAVLLHGVVLGFAWTSPDISLEGSAGKPGSVWGLPVETIADTVDPTQAPASAADAVDTPEPEDVTEPVDTSQQPDTPTPLETTESVDQPEALEYVDADEMQTASAAEQADSAARSWVVDEIVKATPPAASVEEPVEIDQAELPAWNGGIAVAATAPTPPAAEPLEEIRTAALAPVSEAEAVKANDVTIPVPPVRPADVPRVTAPPKPKQTASKPAPRKSTTQAAPKAAAPAPQSSSTRTASAPAGEQAGSSGTRSAAAGRQLVTSYAGRVASHLQRHKRYPADAKRSDTGTATITFTIGSDGRVRASRLSRSSGVSSFDREVLAMVSRATPFPPIPPVIGKSAMTFTVPVKFRPR